MVGGHSTNHPISVPTNVVGLSVVVYSLLRTGYPISNSVSEVLGSVIRPAATGFGVVFVDSISMDYRLWSVLDYGFGLGRSRTEVLFTNVFTTDYSTMFFIYTVTGHLDKITGSERN